MVKWRLQKERNTSKSSRYWNHKPTTRYTIDETIDMTPADEHIVKTKS